MSAAPTGRNGFQRHDSRPGTITGLLAATAAAHPDRIALQIWRGNAWKALTYRQLGKASQRLARKLLQEGYAPGDRALLLAESQPAWVVAYLGASAAGLTLVPLDPQTRPQEVLDAAQFVEARLLFVSAWTAGALEPYADRLRAIGVRVERIEPLTRLEKESPLAEEWIDRSSPQTPASIVFTSGVLVEPRAAVLTHRNLLANVWAVTQVLPPRPDDQVVSVLPLNHVFEFTTGLLGPMSAGATITYAGSLSPRTISATIARVGGTVMLGMPRLFQMFYELARRRAEKNGGSFEPILRQMLGDTLRLLVSGGAALDPEIYDAYCAAGLPIHEGYGLTEAGPVLTVNPPGRSKRGSVGRPLPGIEVRVDSPDPLGEGEILARGPNVMVGYYRNPEATQQALHDGWLHTGDLGRFDEEGYLYITGRIKEVIVTSAGKNVYPFEVEQLYADLPGVREICVVGVSDAHRREEVHAVLVLAPGLPDAQERAQEAMQARGNTIPSYQRIQHAHFWRDPLPRRPDGTVDRQAVRERLQRAEEQSVPPRSLPEPSATGWQPSDWQRELIEEIARLVQVTPGQIRPKTSFDRDLQLDSLMKVELMALLESRLNIPVPDYIALKLETVQDVFDYLAPYFESEIKPQEPTPRENAYRAVQRERYLRQYLHKTSAQRLAAAGFRGLLRVAYKLGFRLRGEGMEHLPPKGPFLIAANHASHLDSGALLALLGSRARDVHVVGAKDYFFDSDIKGWFVSTFLNVLPFDRQDDFLQSLQLSQDAVRLGRSLIIFPEGTRSRTGRMAPFKPGLGLLALELQVPIVPAYIHGTYEALPPGRAVPRLRPIQVRFGQPIDVSEYADRLRGEPRYLLYREIAARVQAAVEALARESSSG